MIAYLELGYLTPLGGLRVCYTDLNIPWYSYTRVYEHMKCAHKYTYQNLSIQIIKRSRIRKFGYLRILYIRT